MKKLSAEKSVLPTMAAISGVRMLVTNEVTTAPNAAPITTATARSSTLPRMMNCRKPLNILPPVWRIDDTAKTSVRGERQSAAEKKWQLGRGGQCRDVALLRL